MILQEPNGTTVHIKPPIHMSNDTFLFVSEEESWYVPYIHRDDGPAVIWPDGKIEWYMDGHKFNSPDNMPQSLFNEYCKWVYNK